MKSKKNTAKKKPAPAKQPQRVKIEVRTYPHAVHVHRNGHECPQERIYPRDTAKEVAKVKALTDEPGAVVSCHEYDQNGRQIG